MKMKNPLGVKVTSLLILLTCVRLTSCINHVCDGYSQWIYISSGEHRGMSQDTSTDHKVINCTSLEEAMQITNLNDTCIVVYKNIGLKEDIVKREIFKFLLTSSTSSPREVICDMHMPVGIAFYKSTNILISNLNFNYCGGERLMKRTCEGGSCLNISTALYFQDSANISINNVHLNSSFGYGLSIVDSNTVLLDTLWIQYSNNFLFEGIIERERIPGGGLYVEYSPNYHAHMNTFQLKSCFFVNNNASMSNEILNKTLPFGKGGGITVLYLGNAVKNIFNCHGGLISNNKAIVGGGVHIYFSDHAVNNSVTFDEKVGVMNNIAMQKGGGSYIVQNKNNNSIQFADVYFLGNTAYIGGCIFGITDNDSRNVFSSEINNQGSNGRIVFRKCVFTSCQGMMGAAMYFQSMYIYFNDLDVLDCQTRDNDTKKGHGAVYALDSLINLHGNISIRHNNGTGFILNYSKMKVFNKTLFKNNTGYNGGALSLYGDSQIILTRNSVLLFKSNNASNKGGAIYSTKIDEPLIPFVSVELYRSRCFIGFEDESQHNFNGSVVFYNNSVKTGFGKDIFCSSLKYCREPNVSSLNKVIAEWTNFQFKSKEKNVIVTDPIHLDLYSEEWKDVYPGKLIIPKIYLRDERNNHVQGEAIITFSSNLSIEQNKGLIVGKNSKILFRILGDENKRYNVTITTTTGIYLSKTLENRYLKFCPFGFKYGKEVRKCLCDYEHNRARGIAECNENQLFLYQNQWVQTNINDSKSNEDLSGYTCPTGYCRKCDTNNSVKIYCNYNADDNQCRDGRDQSSRLCGKCESGKSVTIGGSQKCEYCHGTYGWIWISFAIIFGLSVFIILLILLQLDIMSYYIGGCLYSYQILYCLYAPELGHNDKFLSIITVFFEFTYLNPYPDLCLFDGMNNLEKMAYNYIIPFWMLIFSWLVYYISSEDKNKLFSKSKLLHAFTIIGLMIYTDLTKISFMILDWVIIDGKKYPYIYADIKYGQGEHLPYFITAIIIIVLFTFCIPMYFIKSALKRLRESNDQAALPSWEYKLSYFLKKERYWFLSYYFASRVGIFLIAIFVQDGPLQTAFVTLACLLIFVIFSVVSPYANPYENYAETFLLAVLTVIGILNSGLQAMYLEDIANIRIGIQVFSYIPIVVVVLKVVQEIICKFCCKEENSKESSKRFPVPYRVQTQSNQPYIKSDVRF